jgi:hypothetical protein
MVIREGPSVAGLPEAELQGLRLRLEAVNLRGLANAVDALLGERPAEGCQVIAAWELAQSGELPRLADQCWAALAPIGISTPPGPAPRVLEGLLAGLYAETTIRLDALKDCRARAERVPLFPTLGSAGELRGLWQRALVSALDDFWVCMVDVYARARPFLLQWNRAEIVRFLELERVRLAEHAERIKALANCVAGAESPQLHFPETLEDVTVEPPSDISGLPSDLTSDIGGVASGVPGLTPGIGSALPALTPSDSLAQPEQIPMGATGSLVVMDYRSLPSAEEIRCWLPVAFLVAVTGLAIVVLVTVAYG